MQTVSDDDVLKRFLEKPRFELARKVYGIYMYRCKTQMNCLTTLLLGGLMAARHMPLHRGPQHPIATLLRH